MKAVETISKKELSKRLGTVQVVNVLELKWHNLGFIKGSKKIPLSELDRRFNELDKSKEVVTYCASYECDASRKAAKKLAAKGFKVSAYEGGIKEWTESNLPTDAEALSGKTSHTCCCG